MRKTATMEIDGRTLTVLEVSLRDVCDVLGAETPSALFRGEVEISDLAQREVLELAREVLPRCVQGMSLDELLLLAPSDIEAVKDKWMEVNAAFFRMAGGLGLSPVVKALMESIGRDFSALLSGLSRAVILGPSTTAGAPSSSPSTKAAKRKRRK